MIRHNCSQYSPEWNALRCGIPSASQFHRVITPKTRKRSAQLEQYARELAAERLRGIPLETISTAAMTDGTEREEQAVASYELTHGIDTEPVGFITTDDGLIGASPDRITPTRLIETKNPKAHTHVGYLLGEGPDDDYRCQLQGQLYVCEYKQVDIISCFPGLPDVVVEVGRDEEFIGPLALYLRELLVMVEEFMVRFEKMGYRPPEPEPEADHSNDFVTDEDVDRILANISQSEDPVQQQKEHQRRRMAAAPKYAEFPDPFERAHGELISVGGKIWTPNLQKSGWEEYKVPGVEVAV